MVNPRVAALHRESFGVNARCEAEHRRENLSANDVRRVDVTHSPVGQRRALTNVTHIISLLTNKFVVSEWAVSPGSTRRGGDEMGLPGLQQQSTGSEHMITRTHHHDADSGRAGAA